MFGNFVKDGIWEVFPSTWGYTAILRKVVGKSARDNPVWVILSALFFKEI